MSDEPKMDGTKVLAHAQKLAFQLAEIHRVWQELSAQVTTTTHQYTKCVKERDELQAWVDNAVASCAKKKCSMREKHLQDTEQQRDELAAHLRWALKMLGKDVIGTQAEQAWDCLDALNRAEEQTP